MIEHADVGADRSLAFEVPVGPVVRGDLAAPQPRDARACDARQVVTLFIVTETLHDVVPDLWVQHVAERQGNALTLAPPVGTAFVDVAPPVAEAVLLRRLCRLARLLLGRSPSHRVSSCQQPPQ